MQNIDAMFYKEIRDISKAIDAKTFLERNSSNFDFCPEPIYYSTTNPDLLQETPTQDQHRIDKIIKEKKWLSNKNKVKT